MRKKQTLLQLCTLLSLLMMFRSNAQTSALLIPNDSTKGKENKAALLSFFLKKTVTLPKGRFYIDGNIELPSDVTITGKGKETECIMTGGAENKIFFRIGSLKKNITLSNFKINANPKSNSGAQIVALFIADRVSNVTVQSLSFLGSRTYGCVQIKGTEDGYTDSIHFSGCRFLEAGSVALELRGVRQIEISQCYFTNWASLYSNAPAIQLQSQKCYNVNIHDNLFDNSAGRQFAIESAGVKNFGNVINANISHNKFFDKKNLGGNGISGYFTGSVFSYNIHEGGNGNQRSGYELFGSDNLISHDTVEAGLVAISAGTVTNTNTHHVVVEENNITTRGKNSSGILIGAWTDLKTTDVTIINNIINTEQASGNSSPITIGFYGQPGIVDSIHIIKNTLLSNKDSNPIRIQAAEHSGSIVTEGNKYFGTFITDISHNMKVIQR